ncbi:unnamed protein product [Ectocarpus sp. 12 AP-2014]
MPILLSGGFCALSLYSEIEMLETVRLGASQINTSGRQRMLSQKISFLSTVNATRDCANDEFITTGTTIIPSFCEDEPCKEIGIETLESLFNLTGGLSHTLTPCSVFENSGAFLVNMEALVCALENETKDNVDRIEVVITLVQVAGAVTVSIMTIAYSLLAKRQSKKSADKLNRMVQYLFHEIRNPLNHVVNGIEHILATDKNLSGTARTEIEQCAIGGLFITSILNDVLTLASLESKNHIFDEYPSSVQKLLDDTARIASLTALAKNTVVDTECSDGMMSPYDMDRVKLSQVLMNLVTNAVKFAGHQKRVVVGAKVVSRGSLRDRLCFYVTDNGHGIAPDVQQRLFEKFKTFSRNSGSGIGLHITQVIVQKMGWHVKVTSPLPGEPRGTKFEFTITLTKSITGPALEEEPQIVRRDVRVLIADDEEINCKILQRKFSTEVFVELGWTSEHVLALEDVLAKAKATPYDVILLDEHFGTEQRGSLFIETLRKNGVESKVFIASANCSSADNKLYMRRGAVGTIPKPTPSKDALLRTIGDAL